MSTDAAEKAGTHSTAGARMRVAAALLTGPELLQLALLTGVRILVGFCDLGLAAAMYVVFLLLQGQAPAHHYLWMPNSILTVSFAAALLVTMRVLVDISSSHAVFLEIQNLASDFMLRLSQGYCEMQWPRFVELNRSELTSIAVHTTREAADFYHRCVEMIAGAVIVFAMTAALLYQSPAAAVAFAAALAAFYGVHRFIIRGRIQHAAAMREASLGELQRDFSELFLSGKEIRTHGIQDCFYERIRHHAGRFAFGNQRTVFLPQAGRIIADQGTVLLLLGLIVAVQVHSGDTRRLLSLLAFYFVLSRRLLPLVSQLSLIAGQMESSFENVRIVDAELKRCRLHRAFPHLAGKPEPGMALQLEQASFAFSGGPSILENVDFRLREGEVAILCGASGIGKTSLLNIVSGVLQLDSGSVRVDRADLTYVPQEIVLLDDTIRNNLRFGLSRVEDGNLMKALAAARLDDFVAALPRGLDTSVGDNGALFSGGQRQRFGLARAILRGSRLLLLDEATSALDENNECWVLNNLAATGTAILLVTHRPQMRGWAHHVYRLKGGRLYDERPSAAPEIIDFDAAMLENA